jgi:hypothetical protein
VEGETLVKLRTAKGLVGAQRACHHGGRAKRADRCNNKYYFAHEHSSLGDAATRCGLTVAKLSRKARFWRILEPWMLRIVRGRLHKSGADSGRTRQSQFNTMPATLADLNPGMVSI